MAKTTATESAISRVRTLYEQMVPQQFEAPVEDEAFRYITVPSDQEDRIVDFFRRGYEPADNHMLNDAKRVVLRIPKEVHDEKYRQAANALRAVLNETDKNSGTFKGKPLSNVIEGRPMTATELKESLPEKEDDDTPDDQ